MNNCNHEWTIEIIGSGQEKEVEFVVDGLSNEISCFFGVNVKCKHCGKYLDKASGVVRMRQDLENIGLSIIKKPWYKKMFKKIKDFWYSFIDSWRDGEEE